MMASLHALFLLSSMITAASAQYFQPCSLLGPFFPAARIDPSSAVLQHSLSSFTEDLDKYLQAGDGDFGPITPTTTSFSITLFAGSASETSFNKSNPFFYEYHHTAPVTSAKFGEVDAASRYAVGELTQLFTVYALLAGTGSHVWNKPITEFLPELIRAENGSSAVDSMSFVEWKEVTLGSLASHMAGVGRDSHLCSLYEPCNSEEFLAKFALQPPLYLPDTTPIFSNAAFQLLSSVVENTTGKPFNTVLQERIFEPLNMTQTTLLTEGTQIFGDGLANTSVVGEPAALSMVSSSRDLSKAGRAMLDSSIISPADTRRWLKPVTSTSNLRNAVGRPWEIYHFGINSTDPVVDIYTKTGSIGRYSSYFGLAPDYKVGFTILAYDEEVQSPDLNAYADVALEALLAIDQLGRAQAKTLLAGNYRASAVANSSLVIRETENSDPGLSVETLVVNGRDWRTEIAGAQAIKPEDLDFRLYPTNLQSTAVDGSMLLKFRAVFQDKSAPIDQGTPTCTTWMGVDELRRDGQDLDNFVFHLDHNGNSTAITISALGSKLQRA